MDQECDDSSEEPNGDISEDLFDDSEEVSLVEFDPNHLDMAEEAGISIKVDAEGYGVEVEVLSDDVSTVLILSPEEECIGAKLQGFIPREDGGPSALEMHGQLVEGDVLTHLNGSNARLVEFSDILKACRSPDRGGLPRPLVMKFSRPEALSVSNSTAPSSSPAIAGKAEAGDYDSAGDGDATTADTTGGGGGSSLLEDLMGGLSLPGFAAQPTEVFQPGGAEKELAARDGGERNRKIPGMAKIKGVFRAEFEAQGMLRNRGDARGDDPDRNGGGNCKSEAAENGRDGTGNSDNASPRAGGEGLFMNVLRRLESIEVLGEETPSAVAPAAAPGGGVTVSRGGGCDDNDDNSRGEGRREGEEASSASRGNDREDHVPPPLVVAGAAGAVGSSLAGVSAKLRSRFRKPGGFGLQSTPSGGGGDGESGKAFVEGATKALTINRERVMGWMKDLRPKDWSPRAANRQVEQEVLQGLRRAVRCLYIDAPEPPVHTSMVVARARPPKNGSDKGSGVDRVIGTGADKDLVKLVWFRSSAGGGFAEIKGVNGPYYQLSADDVGSRICVKCTLEESALSAAGVGVSPARAGNRVFVAAQAPSPTRQQAHVAFSEVGPIILDPAVEKEVNALVAQDPAAFEGLVRRDVPGESVRVRVEVGSEKVRVLEEPGSMPPAKTNVFGSISTARTRRDKGPVVLAEGRFSGDVLVSLDPTRPKALKLTIFQGRESGEGCTDNKIIFSLGAADGQRRDVLALTLRARRQDALGPEVVVDDYPEETKVQELEENYLELKAVAAHFAKAFDEDGMMEEDDDEEEEEEEEEPAWEDLLSFCSSENDEMEESTNDRDVEGYGIAHGPGTIERDSAVAPGVEPRDGEVNHAARGLGWNPARCDTGDGAGWEGEGKAPRSLSEVLEDLREARADTETKERRLGESHAAWEAADAAREKAEAELRLVSSELDLLRPLSRSLAARAEGKGVAEEKAIALDAEVSSLKKQLAAVHEEADKLRSWVAVAEDEAGATVGKLRGLEKVVRRLGEEAEAANNNLAGERAAKEEATGRSSKVERELDLTRARAAVLENKLVALEKETLEFQADAIASKARAEAIEEKLSSARAAEVETLTSRVSELEAEVSSIESAKDDAILRMESALASQAVAEARAKEAVAGEEETRARMEEKSEQVMQLIAQRNSAKNRADSLAKDLSRVCGGGRTVDQIEAIVTRYAELKVQMAVMKAEKDGASADLHDQWPTGFDPTGKKSPKGTAETAKRAMRENTELKSRVTAMTETLQMRAQQLEGQRQSNEFLLNRVEELERQVAATSGVPAVGTD